MAGGNSDETYVKTSITRPRDAPNPERVEGYAGRPLAVRPFIAAETFPVATDAVQQRREPLTGRARRIGVLPYEIAGRVAFRGLVG